MTRYSRTRIFIRRFLGWLSIVGLFVVLLIWWQRDSLPEQIIITLPKQQPVTPFLVPTETPAANGVELVYSAIVLDETQGLTTNLHLDSSIHETDDEWPIERTTVETYLVESGDTVWGIAVKFGLDLETLIWSNPSLAENPDHLQVGSELVILPISGIYHTVLENETIEQIARQYGVSSLDIANYPVNDLVPPYILKAGEKLIVPNGQRDIQTIPPDLDEAYPLAWPLTGIISQGYSPTHPAIDIATVYGADVFAAAEGIVLHAAWAETGYGFTVIINHGQNRHTLYSHLKGALVKPRQTVTRGKIIGQAGSTGNATGPHVHFEVRENGRRVNPLNYMKPNF